MKQTQIRVIYDLRGNAHVVDELTFFRITGMGIAMHLKYAIGLIPDGYIYEAEMFYRAAMLSLDRHFSL